MKNKIIQNKKFTKGFTLLELLVVVLIIGILAAIALPQYRKATEKSKASQGLVLLKAINESFKSFYLVNNNYPTDFDQIDVSLPEGFDIDENFVPNYVTYGKTGKDWNISFEKYTDGSVAILYMIRTTGKYKGAGFAVSYSSTVVPTGKILCYERTSVARYLFTKLPKGAFCENVMGLQNLLHKSGYGQIYDL